MLELNPFVSVIVPTYNDWDRLKLCLDAIKAQDYPKNKFEVLVVNNNPEELPPYDIEFYNIRLINENKVGSYAARNAAINVAKGDIFAFTDSDCIPNELWLYEGVKAIISNEQNSIVAGFINIFPKIKDKPNIFELYSIQYELKQSSYVKNDRFATANVFIKKNVFATIGKFDPSLKSGGDFEFASRAVEKNFLISYCKSSVVSHPARSTFDGIKQKAKRKAGGVFDLNKSILKMLLSIFKSLIISCSEIIILKISLVNKFKLIIIIFINFFVKFFEILGLVLWKSKSNRK